MITALLLTAAASCNTADINAPYTLMKEGFHERDPAIVASARRS